MQNEPGNAPVDRHPADVSTEPESLLLQSLAAHQAELEAQNETLRAAKFALQHSSDRYLELYDLAPVGYVTVNRRGTVREANLCAAKLLGVARAQLLGSTLALYAEPGAEPALARHLEDAFARGAARTELPFAPGTKGPPLRLRLESEAIVHPTEGAQCRTVLVDVTDLLTAERLARESHEQLQTVLNTAVDAIISIDGLGIIESFNAAAEVLFGHKAADVIGRNVKMLMPAPYADEHDAYLRRHRDAAPTRLITLGREVRGLHKNGTTFPLAVRIGEHGFQSDRRYTAILRDVSERGRLENELRQAHKLEPIGRLASGLAHEYQNMLMGIQGFTSMALDRLGDSPAREFVEAIRATAGRGSALAGQLLTFTRKDAGGREPTEIDTAVEASTHLLRTLLRDDVSLDVDLAAPGACVVAFPGAFQQILLNLSLNASDAMPAGGRLSIRTRAVAPEGNTPQAAIYVEDTGCGMNAATRARLFEPFFTTKPEGTGTGLGLVAVQRIVSQLGGAIEVETGVGRGTTFCMTLPVQRAGETRQAPQPERPPTKERGTVLVVEDERLVLVTVEHYLSRAGYRALLAPHPLAALELARSQPPGSIDILLTDVSLPHMGGRELSRTIREIHPTIAVVFMSAYPRAQLIREDRIDAEAPTLEKPFDEEELTRQLARFPRGP